MWLACLFGEAFACSVRVGMQKGAKLSELHTHVSEQYQIAVFYVKSSGEASQDAQTRFPAWVSHLEGSQRSCGLRGDAHR